MLKMSLAMTYKTAKDVSNRCRWMDGKYITRYANFRRKFPQKEVQLRSKVMNQKVGWDGRLDQIFDGIAATGKADIPNTRPWTLHLCYISTLLLSTSSKVGTAERMQKHGRWGRARRNATAPSRSGRNSPAAYRRA